VSGLTPGWTLATLFVGGIPSCSKVVKLFLPNRAPTDITLAPAEIDENMAAGTVVGTFSSADPEKYDTHAYSFSAGPGDTDNGYFNIEGDTLRTSVSLDFEAKSSCSIRVRSTDQDGLYCEKALTVGVNNVPEPSIVTFNPNGGTVFPASIIVTNGMAYGELPTPIRAGYTFGGWWTVSDVYYIHRRVATGDRVEAPSDHTLCARWDFAYSVVGDAVIITGYLGMGGEVTIPEAIEGLPVTSIADFAFFGADLFRVTVPPHVTHIGASAFDWCFGLTSVYFKGNAPHAGSGVFGSDYDVTVYYMPDTMGWGETFAERPAALYLPFDYVSDGYGITITRYTGEGGAVVIPRNIEGLPVLCIRDTAFEDCVNLVSVTVPGNLLSIGNAAFANCTNLASVTFAGNVVYIGDFAFSNCSRLDSVFFTDNAPYYGYDVFSAADNVTVYYLPGTLGWEYGFAWRWPVQWSPRIQAVGAPAAGGAGGFSFCISGNMKIPVKIETCTSLKESLWVSLQSAILENGTYTFRDLTWTNRPARFYRVRMP
jgi:hypothetical protein